MGRNLSWRSDRSYCSETNRDGRRCGNTVPNGFRVCTVHRHRNERDARAREYRRIHGHWPGEVRP